MSSAHKDATFLRIITGLITLISGIGIVLTLPGGCMVVLMIPAWLLTALLFLILVIIPCLYFWICKIPLTSSAKRKVWISAGTLTGWFLVLCAADTVGLGRCIS